MSSEYMFKDVYIISIRNPEPAEPEYMYYCGAKPPISDIHACVDRSEVRWDPSASNGYKLRSFEATAETYRYLKQIGFEDVRVFKVVTALEPCDGAEFEKAAIKAKANEIVNMLEADDKEFLTKIGVLDLTIVT